MTRASWRLAVIAWLRRLARHPSRTPALAALLLLVALSMPVVRLPRDTFETLVVFDITQSMDVEDVELDGALVSRIAFARESARRSLREMPCGSRVGWSVFTEYRTLVLLAPVEVCGNYADLLATLDRIDGRIRWGNASEISKGVFWALRASKELGSNPSVLFVTDGQESPPLGSSNYPMFDDLKAGQVRGWLLGVGGKVPKPIPRTNADGERIGYWRAEDVIQRDTPPGAPRSHEHLSELNDAHLRALAAEVGFDYATLDEPPGFLRAMRDPRLARRAVVATDLAWLPAAAAFLLLALHFRPHSMRMRLRLPGTRSRTRDPAQGISRTSGT